MPTLQSSGAISIGDINDEAGYDTDAANTSLATLSVLAATLSAINRPNVTVGTPYAMSEFYDLNAGGGNGNGNGK